MLPLLLPTLFERLIEREPDKKVAALAADALRVAHQVRVNSEGNGLSARKASRLTRLSMHERPERYRSG